MPPFAPVQPPTAVWEDKRDGQWLSELLGIPQSAIDGVEHAAGRDQIVGRAMGTALWPATLGYMLETLMHPIFSGDTVDGLRWFHNHFVSGRGWVPAVRVGKQPYGILPTSAMRRWRWVTDQLAVPAAGAGAPSPAGRLLVPLLRDASAARDRLGGHESTSVCCQPTGRSASTSARYSRTASDVSRVLSALRAEPRLHSRTRASAGRRAQRCRPSSTPPNGKTMHGRCCDSWDTPARRIPTFSRASSMAHSSGCRARSSTIDCYPRRDPVRAYTDNGRNYLRWLIDTARVSLDALRAEHGFTANEPPTALLYLMLRHALILGYWDTSVRLFIDVGVLDATAQPRCAAKRRSCTSPRSRRQSESRWAMLYSDDVRVTGAPGRLVADHIASILGTQTTRHLDEQLAALERLKDVPTAQLERAFAEHVDCASYRLDAWVQGMIHAQLSVMRQSARAAMASHKRSQAFISARSAGSRMCVRTPDSGQPVQLPPDLVDFFAPPGSVPLVSDATNGGYMHDTVAEPRGNGGRAAQRLSRERERGESRQLLCQPVVGARAAGARSSRASATVKASAPCSATGFERGLHDRHAMAEVDEFISRCARRSRSSRGPPRRHTYAAWCADRGDRGAQRSGRRKLVDRIEARAMRRTRSASTSRPRRRGNSRRSTRKWTRCSTSTTPSPTSRSRRACTRRCKATSTARLPLWTRTARAVCRRSPT